jgi:hypothetical protein
MVNTPAFYTPNSPATQADVDNVAAMLALWVQDQYAPIVAQNVIFDYVQATDLSIAGGAQSRINLATPGTANVAQDGADSLLALLKTSGGGRVGSGRFYTMAPAQDAHDFGRWQASYVNAVQLALGDLKIVLAAAGYFFAVASRHTQKTYQVNSINVPNKYSYQTRRAPGRGSLTWYQQ